MKLALSGWRKRMKQSFRPKQKKTYNYQNALRLVPSKATPAAFQPVGTALQLVNKLQPTFRVLIRKHMNNMFCLAFPVHFHDPEILFHPSVHMGWYARMYWYNIASSSADSAFSLRRNWYRWNSLQHRDSTLVSVAEQCMHRQHQFTPARVRHTGLVSCLQHLQPPPPPLLCASGPPLCILPCTGGQVHLFLAVDF